jgi:hypothetical protein
VITDGTPRTRMGTPTRRRSLSCDLRSRIVVDDLTAPHGAGEATMFVFAPCIVQVIASIVRRLFE